MIDRLDLVSSLSNLFLFLAGFVLVSTVALIGLRRLSQRLEKVAKIYERSLTRAKNRAVERKDENTFHLLLAQASALPWLRRTAPIWLVGLVALMYIAAVVLGEFGIPILVMLLLAALPLALAELVDWLELRRTMRIERALPDAIGIISSAVGAGLTFQAALGAAAGNLRGPLAVETRVASNEIAAGSTTAEALQSMAIRSGSLHVGVFAAVVRVHLRTGGDLAVVLQGFGRAMTKILLAQDEVRAKTARTRYEARICTLIPFAVLPLAGILQPDIFGELFFSTTGRIILAGAAALWGGSVWRLQALANTKV